jgi:hypothetical protein
MKRVLVLAACLVPAAAFAQDSYTNADLAKFQVPGAYTNQDLKRLSPLPMQGKPTAAAAPIIEAPAPPTAAYQSYYDNLRGERDSLQDEIDIEKGLVDFSESAYAGDTRSYDVRLGYRAQAAPIIRELNKRVALLDAQLSRLEDHARREGVSLDRR